MREVCSQFEAAIMLTQKELEFERALSVYGKNAVFGVLWTIYCDNNFYSVTLSEFLTKDNCKIFADFDPEYSIDYW